MREKDFKLTTNSVENEEVDARPQRFDAEPGSEKPDSNGPKPPSKEIPQELPSEKIIPEPTKILIGSGFPLKRGSTASDALIAKTGGEPINK